MTTDAVITLTELGWLARLLCGHTPAREVAALIERVVRDNPGYSRGAALLYLELGHPSFGQRALEHLRADFAAKPMDVDTLGLIGRAFALAGNEEAARAVEWEIQLLQMSARERS